MKSLILTTALSTVAFSAFAQDTDQAASERRFGTSFGREYSGTAILDLFKDDKPSGISPYIELRYGNEYGLDLVARGSVNLWYKDLKDFPIEKSDIGVPVYSDIRAYRTKRTTLDRLYASYNFKVNDDIYGRVVGGILETEFSGAMAEIVYAPSDSPFAISAEIAKLAKRNPYETFETMAYEPVVGNLTAYYDTGYPGWLLSASYGQYLAEDQGTTITAAKRFNNGLEIKGEVTATNHYFDTENEDYLVQSISLYIPLNLVGKKGRFALTPYNPSKTDAGRSLSISGELYDSIRGYEAKGYTSRWGGF